MGSKHPRRGRRKFTDEQFLKAWESCESQAQVAARLGVARETIGFHVARMRASGVELAKQEVCQ